MSLNKTSRRFLFAIFMMSIGNVSFALENDNQQPIYIDSNTASYDQQQELSVYTGDVIFTQGSLIVKSDSMTFHLKQGEISKIVVKGQPATFKQTPKKNRKDINGQALIGEYYPASAKLQLMGKAVIWQGGNQSKSDLIVYDTKHSVIRAGDKTSGSKRVHTVFQPKAKK